MRRSRREWLMDSAAALIAALLGLFFLVAIRGSEPEVGPPLAWDLVFGTLACAAILLFHRRWPVGTTVGLLLTSLVALSGIGTLGVALGLLAMRRPWPVIAAVGALQTATVFLAHTTGADDWREYLEGVTVVLCFHFTLVAAGMILRSNRRLMASLKDRAVQAEEGQRMRVEEARHLERERIAREMHDVLAHRISLLAVHAGALEFRPDASPQEKQAAGVIRESAHEALEDLRAVIGMLRTDERDAERPQPTLAGLPELIEESRRAGARVTVTGADTAQAPDRIGRHAYRIVQEGLTNARKHAPAAKVEVTLSTDQGELCLEVRNRLTVSSAPAIPGAGAGIIGLRERVALLGGRLEAGPTPDGDFRLTAWLPLPS